MSDNATIINHLNTVLCNELTAINQYVLHARTFEHWGFSKIGEKVYQTSIDEMKDADELIKRILFLGGLPNVQKLEKILIGEHPQEALECDHKLELIAVKDLRAAITDCEQAKDFVSRDLLQKILNGEEDHIDWLETQLEIIKRIGVENYLQTQI